MMGDLPSRNLALELVRVTEAAALSRSFYGERAKGSCRQSRSGCDEIQGKLYTQDEKERAIAEEMGYDFDNVITMDDLVSSDDIFFTATGITDGLLLDGVKYFSHGARTDSLVICGKTGTVRQIIARHNFNLLNPISQIEY